MRRTLAVAVALLAWSTIAAGGQQAAVPCSGRVDELQLLTLAVQQLPEKELLLRIQACGSALELTPAVEARLRAVGLGDAVLAALRSAGARAPSPSAPYPWPGFVTGIASDEFRQQVGFPADRVGARVLRVLSESPAARAGLLVGDIVVGLNGTPLLYGKAAVSAQVEREASIGMRVRLDVFSRSGTATVNVDIIDLAPFLTKHCDEGVAYACTVLGAGYSSGLHLTKNDARAAELWRRACDLGDPVACRNLAREEWFQRPGGPGTQAAAGVLRKSCDRNDEEACAVLGLVRLNDNPGLPKDEAEAQRLFRRGCEIGSELGCRMFAYNAFEKQVRGDGASLAASAYNRACEVGDLTSCHNLGSQHWTGTALPENERRAVALWTQACEGGKGISCESLAILHFEGHAGQVVIQKDPVQGLAYRRKAAEYGHAASQRLLGEALAKGAGLPQSSTDAAAWFAKAAEQDDASAQFFLARQLVRGDGVARDDVAAMLWLTLALESLEPDAAWDWIDEARKLAAAMKTWMTPAEVAEAQKRVAARKAK